MKRNFNKKMLSFTLVVATALSMLTSPVYAISESTNTESTEETATISETTEDTQLENSETETPETESSEVEVNETKVVITAKNTDNNSRIETAVLSVKDANGNLLTFNKSLKGDYEYSASGSITVLEANSKGKVTITNLEKGAYTVVDAGTEKKYVCYGTSSFTIATLTDEYELTMEYYSNVGSLGLTFLDSDDNSVIEKGIFVLKDSAGNVIPVVNTAAGTYTYSNNSYATGEFITNAGGKVTVTGIPAGTYTLEQTHAPSKYNTGYVTQTVEISAKNTTAVTVYNGKKYGDALIKVSSSIDSSKLAGYEFKIVNEEDFAMPVYKTSDNVYYFNRSGENTTVKLENASDLVIIGLPEGTYYLHMSKGINNYKDIEDVKFNVVNGKETTVNITAKRATGTLSITKTDEATKEGLEGFKITLIDKSTNKELFFVKNDDGTYSYTVNSDNAEKTLVTDSKGKIVAKGIPTGNVYIKETAAAEGYMFERETAEQTISNDTETVFVSTAKKSNCVLEIVNPDGKAVKGVSVVITNADNEVVYDGKTNENGFVLMSNFSAGTYTYEIVGVPSTYSLPQLKAQFSVDNKGVASGLEEIVIEYNKIVVKVEGIKENAEGLVFTLINDKGEEFSATTDGQGFATFMKVPHGTYTLKQTETIKGYAVSEEIYKNILVDEKFENVDNKFTFNVKEDTSSDTSSIIDTKSKGGLTALIVVLVLVLLAAIGGVVYVLMKNKKDSANKPEENTKQDTAPVEEPTVSTEEPDMPEAIVIEEEPVEEIVVETTTEELIEENIVVPEDVNDRKPSKKTSEPIDPFK